MRVSVFGLLVGLSFFVAFDTFAQEADSLYALAVEAHDSGDSETAIALYTRVIELDDTNANAFWNRANLRPVAENQKALEDYARVTELVPQFDGGHGNYGHTLILAKRLKEARAASLKAHRLDNTVYSWPLNIGHTYMLEGKIDSAKTFYRWALYRMESRDDLESAVTDFDLFLERGWSPEESTDMRNWMLKSYEGTD